MALERAEVVELWAVGELMWSERGWLAADV